MADEKLDSKSGAASGRRASRGRKGGAKEEGGQGKGDPLDRIDFRPDQQQQQQQQEQR
jgi:hypothetical protein